MPNFYMKIRRLLGVDVHCTTITRMTNESSAHAASESSNNSEVATSSQRDDRKASLENLPYDILFKLLSLSLEPYLLHTSQAIRQKLSSGFGGDKAFSIVAKSILLVALLPPSSWAYPPDFQAAQLSSKRDFSFLGAERSCNTAQHVLLQEQVFRSGWFHPRVVRLLLPQLMKISLERIIGTAEAISTLQFMCEQYPNFLMLGQGPELYDSFIEYLSSEGIKTRLGPIYPFITHFSTNSSVDFRNSSLGMPHYLYVVGMCHIPDALLECACLGTEESIQLVWMFHEMMRISEQAHKQENSGVFPVSINEALLAHAIETNLSQGNVDAVRTLVRLHEHVAIVRADPDVYRYEGWIKPRWYLLAAKSPDKLMLHNLALLEMYYGTRGVNSYKSMPYWDSEFVQALTRLVRTGVDWWTLQAYASVLRAHPDLKNHKTPDGDWVRLLVGPTWESENDFIARNYSSWMAHRQHRAKEMARDLGVHKWYLKDLNHPKLMSHIFQRGFC